MFGPQGESDAMSTHETNIPQLLTAQQVAERLGLSNKLVYLLAARGDLPVVRISRRAVRFDSEDVVAWLRQRKSPVSRK